MKQSLGLQSIENARELGGYPVTGNKTVKKGMLLRTASLYNISATEAKLLKDRYQVRAIVDFRSTTETTQHPDPDILDATKHLLPVIPEKDSSTTNNQKDLFKMPNGNKNATNYKNPFLSSVAKIDKDIDEVIPQFYATLVANEYSIEIYKHYFEILLKNKTGAVLWHCTQGKDRTGIAAALTLAALGADRNTIIDDYLLTNPYTENFVNNLMEEASQETNDPYLLKQLKKINQVKSHYLEACFHSIDKHFGSLDQYLTNQMQLDMEKREKLKEIYLV